MSAIVTLKKGEGRTIKAGGRDADRYVYVRMPWRYCHGICAISCYVEIISASVNGYKNHNMEGDRYEIPGNRRGNAEDRSDLH